MVPRIGVSAQNLACTCIFCIFVLAKLAGGVGASRRVDHDLGQTLQPLHAFAQAAGAFAGGAAGQAGGAVIRAGLRLGAVSDQKAALVAAHTTLEQKLCRVRIGAAKPRQFVKNHQPAPRRVVSAGVVGPRVGPPAPVHAVINSVERQNFIVRHHAQLQVGKHGRTAAHHLAAVLVAVGLGVGGAQMLGVGPKALAQQGAGQVLIGGVMHQFSIPFFQRVAVDPAACHGGRVKTF